MAFTRYLESIRRCQGMNKRPIEPHHHATFSWNYHLLYRRKAIIKVVHFHS